MTENKDELTIIQQEDGSFTIQGNEADVKKASMVVAEFLLNEDKLTDEKIETIVNIAENLYSCNASPEELKAAKHFLETLEEKYLHPRAMYELAMQEENPLIAEARMVRAATIGAPPAIGTLWEEYTLQKAYWQKKINEAEGTPFDDDAPTVEEILDSDRMRFFEIYERAFKGDPKAMKICLEFCNEEVEYWNNR